MSLRLYVPALREIAPQSLEDHAHAARAVNHIVAPVVACELLQDDLTCRSICPMCTLGACGGVSACTHTIDDAWQETAPAVDSPPPGFLLQAPRPTTAATHREAPQRLSEGLTVTGRYAEPPA